MLKSIKTVFSADHTFFSSDLHLDHINILKYDQRPFKTIDEMNEALIQSHNNVVKNDDVWFFLGDFCFTNKNKNKIDYFLSRMNGQKYFIKGNHDHEDTRRMYEKHGIYLGEKSMIKVKNDEDQLIEIVLDHFPGRSWNKSHHGSWMLYGHHHGSIEHTPYGKSMDVGVMLNNWAPFSFRQIETIMNKRKSLVLVGDHHNGTR